MFIAHERMEIMALHCFIRLERGGGGLNVLYVPRSIDFLCLIIDILEYHFSINRLKRIPCVELTFFDEVSCRSNWKASPA